MWVKIIGATLLALFLVALISITILAKMARDLPNPAQFGNRSVSQSTKIYDRTEQTLLYEMHGEERRTVLLFDQIPDYVKKATIAAEDQSFYSHHGFDWRGILRALFVDMIRGKVIEGGSTITQQLAKNAFLTLDRTLSRKVKELILAYWIEKQYTKDEILGLYLNQIPYGSNAYGIEAASETYFGKQARDLTLAESATIVSIAKATTYYSPWGSHQDELMRRKDYILDQMRGLGFIDDQQLGDAKAQKLSFATQSIAGIKAPHFVMAVREYLANIYGEDVARNGGLRVITTLDASLQEIAERVVKEGASKNTEAYDGHNAALVAEDPKTGQVLALVGSKDYFGPSEPANCIPTKTCQFEGNFNVATQGLRQPGSSFKPFIYVTAFEKGYAPQSILFDLPTEFSTHHDACPATGINYNEQVENPLCFHPEDFDHAFRGPVALRTALAQSINVPSVKLLYLVGMDDALKTAREMGITTLTDPSRYGLSLVLGGGEVKLVDMVHAYSVFAQEGVRHAQSFILSVADADGKILEQYTDQATQIINPQYTRLINDILSDTDARAPLFQNSLALTTFPDRDVALKTGTTNNYRDAWTIGYTPSLVAGVWAGNNDARPMQKRAGSILAAIPIWHAFMDEALQKYPQEAFTKPDPVAPQKPTLNGSSFVNGEAHTILYYVDKKDPLGPPPQSPSNDPQFDNWELPVRAWAGTQFITPSLSATTTPL